LNTHPPNAAPISQKDIAAALHLSQATVSLALKNHPRISQEVRELVQAKAQELGYRPNPTLSALASKRFGTERREIREVIAFVRPDITYALATEDLLAEKATTLGYGVQGFSPTDFTTSKNLQQILTNRGMRGVIVDDSLSSELELGSQWNDFVVVRFGLRERETPLSSVHLDHFAAIHVAFDEAIKAGFRRIAFGVPGHLEPARRMQQAALGLQAQVRGQSAVITDVIAAPKPNLAVHLAQDVERVLSKPKQRRPQCLIASGWWARKAVAESGHQTIPTATFFPLRRLEESAGFEWVWWLVAEATLDLLHRRLMENDYGRPRIPQTIAILPPWRDHPSFRPAP